MTPNNPTAGTQPNKPSQDNPIARNQVLILISNQLLSRIVATQRALNSFVAPTHEEEPPPVLLQLPSVVQVEGGSAYLTISLILHPHTPPQVSGIEYQLERALYAVLTFPLEADLTDLTDTNTPTLKVEEREDAHPCQQ